MHPSPEGTPRTVSRRGLGEVNCQLASETRLVGAPGLARKSRGWRLGLTQWQAPSQNAKPELESDSRGGYSGLRVRVANEHAHRRGGGPTQAEPAV